MENMEKKKFIILLLTSFLAIFLAAFVAFYVFEKNTNRTVEYIPVKVVTPVKLNSELSKSSEKMIEGQEKYFNQLSKEMDNIASVPVGIMRFGDINPNNIQPTLKTEELKDAYLITVNLKPFNNDEKNVKIKVNSKSVIVSADYTNKDKNNFNSSSFYQSWSFPSKVDAKAYKKEVKGDNLVIAIPKKIGE